MRTMTLGGLLAPMLAAVLASAGCPASTENQDACKAYVKHHNSLDCAPALSAADACPTSFDGDGAAKCVDYFACLEKETKCDGDAFTSGIEACAGCQGEE